VPRSYFDDPAAGQGEPELRTVADGSGERDVTGQNTSDLRVPQELKMGLSWDEQDKKGNGNKQNREQADRCAQQEKIRMLFLIETPAHPPECEHADRQQKSACTDEEVESGVAARDPGGDGGVGGLGLDIGEDGLGLGVGAQLRQISPGLLVHDFHGVISRLPIIGFVDSPRLCPKTPRVKGARTLF
jgi:hypothetical protein